MLLNILTVHIKVALVVKNPPANVGDIRTEYSTLGSGRSPGGGHGNPLQYILFPEESHRQRSLACYGPQGRTELDTNEATQHAHTHGYKRVREEHRGLFQSHRVIPLSFSFHLAKAFTDLFLFTAFRSVLRLRSSVTSYKN